MTVTAIEADAAAAATLAMCVECEDTEAGVRCADCADFYCVLCFDAQHRAGSRLAHARTLLTASAANANTLASAAAVSLPEPPIAAVAALTSETATKELPSPAPIAASSDAVATVTTASTQEAVDASDTSDSDDESDEEMPLADDDGETALMRSAAFTPMRLTEDERSLFNLLDASLNVSEYTDKVDVLSYQSQAKRVVHELHETFSIVSGMMVANDFRQGKQLVQDRKFNENEAFFRRVFEIGRRYKIMNPGVCVCYINFCDKYASNELECVDVVTLALQSACATTTAR